MNMKINPCTLALVAMALTSVVTGCAGVGTMDGGQAMSIQAAKTQIVYGQVMHGFQPSVKSVCAGQQLDDRCVHPEMYSAAVVNMRSAAGGFGASYIIKALVPKSESFSAGDILKIKLHGAAPAAFLAVASRGDTPGCGWKRGFPSGGGVVCEGFDYRKDLAD